VKRLLGIPNVYVVLLKQDDPRKCTAAKLTKFRMAIPIYRLGRIPRNAIVLNPFAGDILLPDNRTQAIASGLVAVDCSWEKAGHAFLKRLPGIQRRLPTLLAANPVNYAKAHKLSSAEALAAAMQIMGFGGRARELLRLFKWGEGFLTLNSEPLESYSTARSMSEMSQSESLYF
jgi:pre-rRNA-processing protein TSR3